ncbi:GMC oxidoreductase [Roseibacterium sp. SDUM158016]|uniref:GMC oxidoreductase n=1 Tax=Roseicyclus sediminis TaxID=2980997 RepID=UPI0021D10625|nr:GMC oxidoreductase [Roseibacterium sp. SDUM158016]MCU4652515.1 GMC oxidoreductase [Roseibacterium sp. SDUM158016]
MPPLAPCPADRLHPPDGSDAATEAETRARPKTIHHLVGTCRIGTFPGAVVDPDFRVRRIAGRNTNTPTLKIGAMVADLIRHADTRAHRRLGKPPPQGRSRLIPRIGWVCDWGCAGAATPLGQAVRRCKCLQVERQK